MNFVRVLRTPFLQKISGQLLLEKALLALISGLGLTYKSPLREIIRVCSQIPTQESIKVKRKFETPRYFALLDTKCFKSSKTERNNKQTNYYYIRPKHCHYKSYYAN